MPRPARPRAIPRKLGIALALLALAGIVGAWALSADAPPAPGELDAALMGALRDGDRLRAGDLLRRGANANARDEAGDTALMRAALYADAPAVRLLLDAGADPQARGRDGTAPLLRATHDIEKMRLLLDRGAAVDDFAVVAAASVPGSREALELLVARGGRGRAAVPAFTALMAAAGNGDLPAASFLLDCGADPRAKTPTGYTALVGAALSGNAELVALLLKRGADPNAAATLERGILQTPAGVAAGMGHAECLRLLMGAGANVAVRGGPFQHSALLSAATTPSIETARLLLPKADLAVTDWAGSTALDWARRRGETEVVALLRAAGAPEAGPAPAPPKAPLFMERHPPDADSARRAVAAALPPLQESGRRITETRGCVSCHQHPTVAMLAGLARERGFAVDEGTAAEERAFVRGEMRARLRPLLLGTGIDPTLAPLVLVGMAAEGEPPSRVTDALVHYLVLRQHPDGRWKQETHRPPDEASDFQFTAMAVRGLSAYAPPGRAAEITARVGRAREWLQRAPPADATDRAFRLLGLKWAGAGPDALAGAAGAVLADQREGGGWAQLPTLGPDAYATGLALYALHEGGGVPADHPAYRRGVEHLVRTQLADGSWLVPTRSFPVVEFSKSGFPHRDSQFISAAATCWAAMSLALAVPPGVRGPSDP